MRTGHFLVTLEMMEDKNWPLIEAEINKVFTLELKVDKLNGLVAFHGVSDLFEESDVPATSPAYDCFFKTVDGNPVFDKFTKI